MARKAGLGRGLDALFADAAPINEEEYTAETHEEERKPAKKTQAKSPKSRKPAAEEDNRDRVLYIDLNDIKPNSAQPRIHFDEEKLNELAGSIKTNGVIQPLIVREGANGYELVAGERRWRASRIAGLKTVPCIVRDFDDRQNAIVAIIENMQREDLNFTQEQVSASLGRSRTYIANSIRLLKLPPEIQEYVSSGQMSAAHGRTIINIPDRAKQKEIADKIIRNDLSVRATEKLAERVKDELKPERKRRKPKAETQGKTEDVLAVERELMTLTGTKVNITGDSRGKLELEYYSIEELNRLIDIIREAFR